MPDAPHVARLLDQLARGPAVVMDLVADVPPSRAKERPAPSKWSAHEHACHLAAVQPLFMARLELMLRDPAAVIRPYNPADDDADDALLGVDLDEAMRHRIPNTTATPSSSCFVTSRSTTCSMRIASRNDCWIPEPMNRHGRRTPEEQGATEGTVWATVTRHSQCWPTVSC